MISIVTGNTSKFQEMQHALTIHGIACERKNIEVSEIQTLDQLDAVKEKAKEAFRRCNHPVLVDDSGFFVERFHLFPGVLSKYIHQMLGYAGLFDLLSEGERAYFQCSVAYMDETLAEPQVFTAQWPGTITKQFDQNTRQFAEMPYVPFMIPDDQPNESTPKPLSQFTPEERLHDHRHTALNAFAAWYQSR